MARETTTDLTKVKKADEQKKKSGGDKKDRLSWWFILLAIIYLISPIDIIPEFILGPAGYIDDAALLMYLVQKLVGRFRS